MILYKVNTNVNYEDYYVVTQSMDDAEIKIKEHLSKTHTQLINITHLSVVAVSKSVGTPDTFIYQYKLVL